MTNKKDKELTVKQRGNIMLQKVHDKLLQELEEEKKKISKNEFIFLFIIILLIVIYTIMGFIFKVL